ncbi:MAG TPA: hypothetical protein VLY04_01130 [Bryobacteraceae bacterium]|nr:hypothetical protein [Bryobacteraceae bacterium]
MNGQSPLEEAFEQFHAGLRYLVMYNGPLEERLSQAWLCHLTRVRERDLADPALADRIAAVKKRCAEVDDLHETEQGALAAEILAIYTAISEQLTLVSSPH